MKRIITIVVSIVLIAGNFSTVAGAMTVFEKLASYIKYGGSTYDEKEEQAARQAYSQNEGKKGFSIFQTMAEYAKWGEMPRKEYRIPTQVKTRPQ